MGIAAKLNSGKKQTVREGINTNEIEYIKIDELAKANPPLPLKLAGFFIKNGEKYGKQVTIIVDDGNDVYGVNIAKRYTEMFEDLTDDEVEDVKAGRLAISEIKPNVSTPRGKTTYIEFIDVE